MIAYMTQAGQGFHYIRHGFFLYDTVVADIFAQAGLQRNFHIIPSFQILADNRQRHIFHVQFIVQPTIRMGQYASHLLDLIGILIKDGYFARLHDQFFFSALQFDATFDQGSLDNRIIGIGLQVEGCSPNSHIQTAGRLYHKRLFALRHIKKAFPLKGDLPYFLFRVIRISDFRS